MEILDTASVCACHPDDKFVQMMKAKKGKKALATNGQTTAYLDEKAVTLNGQKYSCTVRSASCEMLTHGNRR